MNSGEQRFHLAATDYKLALARDAIHLEDRAKVLNNDHAVVNSHHKHNLPEYVAPEEPVIHIGDQHTHQATAHTPRKGMHPLLAAAVGAGLMASGIGIPAGAWFLADAIKQLKPATPPPATNPGDGNTKYRLRLIP